MNDRTSSSVHGVTLRGRSFGPGTPSVGFHAIFRSRTASVNARRRTVSIICTDRGVTSGPVLLLVDYAEACTELDGMLRAVLADPGPIRVLLVARSLGEWWDRLIEMSPSGRTPAYGGRNIELAEQITQGTPNDRLVAAAVPQFAHALSCPTPERGSARRRKSG